MSDENKKPEASVDEAAEASVEQKETAAPKEASESAAPEEVKVEQSEEAPKEAPADKADNAPKEEAAAEKPKKAEEASSEEKAPRAARPERAAKKEAEPEEPKEPSPNQPLLDRIVAILKENVAESAVEEAYINERDGHRPVLVIANEHFRACARILKEHTELGFNYLRNVSGVDYETYMEVDYFLLSMLTKQECMIKIKADREAPVVASATPVWETANWNEREIYDLLGISFSDHPDLRRIMMPDNWVGHPLRKDYEPYDPEV